LPGPEDGTEDGPEEGPEDGPEDGREDGRAEARRLFDVAVAAADPAAALSRAFDAQPPDRPGPGGRTILIAVGKAAVPMARTALSRLAAPVEALIVTNAENASPVQGARLRVTGHPVPNEAGAAAGEEVLSLLTRATTADRVVALISGGGSALLPAPAPGLTLADKAAVNRALLAGGLPIAEVNLIRQQLSRLKGGGFLRAAAPAPVAAYILSDVVGDDLAAIASGPTVAPLGTRADARNLLIRRGLWDALPQPVRTHLSAPEPQAPPLPPARNLLIGSNRLSLQAMAAAHPGAILADAPLEGDVSEAAERIILAAKEAPPGACLIFGGETVVTLKGKGLGGRNQELALRVALAAGRIGRPFVFLSGGTDGRDGPTEAAGGIVDDQSGARMRAAGIDAQARLADNDSNPALAASGDLLMTGGTGTNVADVQVLIL